jgi:hypothetical protein
MFGDAWCVIAISQQDQNMYAARPYVLGHRGRSPRAVGDRDGRALTFSGESIEDALAKASDYMEDRFGPRRVAPAPTTSYVTAYVPGEPAEAPLADLRAEPVVVVATERIVRGDDVVVAGGEARLARFPVRGLPSGGFLATAAEDIDKGQRGRVRPIQEDVDSE